MKKTQKKRSRGKQKYYYVIIPLLALIILITISELNRSTEKKPLCREYLKIQHTRSWARTYTNDNQTILIKALGINITAIKGDAHNIVIDSGGFLEPITISNITKGETKDLSIEQISLPSEFDEEKGVYIIPLEVRCTEAEADYILIEARPEDILITSSGYP